MLRPGPIRLCLRLARFLPLCAVPLAVNWYCAQEPFAQRRLAEAAPEVDALVAGHNIWTTADLRALKLACLKRLPAPDILVLGGSRAFPISTEELGSKRVFNATVTRGDLEDSVAWFQAAVSAGKTPRAVLLEINPMLTHLEVEDREALTFSYGQALERYGLQPYWRYFFRLGSFQSARGNLRPPLPEWGIWTKDSTRTRLAPDGSVHWRDWESPAELDRVVHEHMNDLSPGDRIWRTQSRPAAHDRRLLTLFLNDLEARGVRVAAFLAPVHPEAYAVYRAAGGYDETWLRQEFSSRGVPVIGSFSPLTTNAAPSEFYDDVHPKPELLRRILNPSAIALLGPAGSLPPY
jgi:hypothetical protein